jgi:hypothetical protein
MSKLPKKKINIAILTFIPLLVIFTCILGLYIYISNKSVNELGEYACTIDQKNNQILISALMKDIVSEKAEHLSSDLKIALNNVKEIGTTVYNCLAKRNSVSQELKDQIKLVKSTKTDVLFDVATKQNILRYYWGENNQPSPIVIEQMASLSKHVAFFRSIYKIHSNYYSLLYVVSKKNCFTFDYPIRTSYLKTGKNKDYYQKSYPFNFFPNMLENKNQIISNPVIVGPYVDIAGKTVITIKIGIYDSGDLIGYAGLDVNYFKLDHQVF